MPRKQKEKEEPGLHSPGVIVTHPENHISPRNRETLWLVAMMAMIGFVAGICTIVLWQKDEISSQFDRMHLSDSKNVYADLANKVEVHKKEIKPCALENSWWNFDSSSFKLALPPCWHVIEVRNLTNKTWTVLSRLPFQFEADENIQTLGGISSVAERADVVIEFSYPDASTSFEEFVADHTDGWDALKKETVVLDGGNNVVRVVGNNQGPQLGYFLDVTSHLSIDGSPYPVYVFARLLNWNKYVIPDADGSYDMMGAPLNDPSEIFTEIVARMKWE